MSNNRASLLAGLRTGGVRSTTNPLPQSAAPTVSSFNIPQMHPEAPMTAAPGATFGMSQLQTPAYAQNQLLQMQMMQYEIMRLQVCFCHEIHSDPFSVHYLFFNAHVLFIFICEVISVTHSYVRLSSKLPKPNSSSSKSLVSKPSNSSSNNNSNSFNSIPFVALPSMYPTAPDRPFNRSLVVYPRPNFSNHSST